MNTEQKARAYDEALERARKMLDKILNSELMGFPDQIRKIFPQLAESEDEKIRKALIEGVSQIRCKGDVTREQMIAYLERQKEHSISITEVLSRAGLKPYKDGNKWCILVGDNIQEGICGFGDTIDEALYQFLLEVLEKQKEQKPIKMETYEVGKGTTICGQDHKCKKDYITGTCRYIKDVIYHCSRDGYLNDQNGVSWSCSPEWFKEYIQSNAEWAEEEKTHFVSGQFLQCKLSFDEFKEGEHYWLEYVGDDMYVGRSDNILNQKFHITPRQLYTLFFQQLEEKQKEQKPVTNEKAEMTDFEQSVYDLCPVLGIEEAKATASDLLELAKKTLLKTGKVVLASNYPEGCSFEDGFHLGYNEGFNAKKEQKPEEVDESTKRLNDNWMKQHFDNYEEQKPAEWSDEDEAFLKVAIAICNRYSHKDIADWLKSLPERFNLQPKQEWSDEDEKTLNAIIDMVGNSLYEPLRPRAVMLSWLNSLRQQKLDASKLENFDPVDVINRIKTEWPTAWEKVVGKQEWSEKDEKTIERLITRLNWITYNTRTNGTSPNITFFDEIEWLKSLRPQSHKEIYQAAKHDLAIKFMNYLDENRPDGKMCLSNGECEDIDKAFKENDWAKIERYIHKYHWKPSEEQMEALKRVAYNLIGTGTETDIYLVQLYEQLKKLL